MSRGGDVSCRCVTCFFALDNSGAGGGFYSNSSPTACAMGYDPSPLTGLWTGHPQVAEFLSAGGAYIACHVCAPATRAAPVFTRLRSGLSRLLEGRRHKRQCWRHPRESLLGGRKGDVDDSANVVKSAAGPRPSCAWPSLRQAQGRLWPCASTGRMPVAQPMTPPGWLAQTPVFEGRRFPAP
jgi:hypothetical protein